MGWVPVIKIVASNMWETSALVEVLERKGMLTKQEVLDTIQGAAPARTPSNPARPTEQLGDSSPTVTRVALAGLPLGT